MKNVTKKMFAALSLQIENIDSKSALSKAVRIQASDPVALATARQEKKQVIAEGQALIDSMKELPVAKGTPTTESVQTATLPVVDLTKKAK